MRAGGREGERAGGREGGRERGLDEGIKYQKLHLSGCFIIFTSIPIIFSYSANN
jgi:hypothetical protein